MRILTSTPSWFIILCLLLGLLIAGILYFKEKAGPYPLWAKWFMAVTRFIAISILAFLLLSPMVRSIMRSVEKPLILFALDNSASMLATADSSYIKEEFVVEWQELVDDLSGKYDTRAILFGDKVSDGSTADFSEKYTDFSKIFDELSTRYLNRNVGAVVLASDGIHNRGINPAYEGMKYPYPIFAIALGDTSVQKDAILVRAHFNRITYLNNRFPLEVIVRATACETENLRIRVLRDGQSIDDHSIMVTSPDFSTSHMFYLEADKTGVLRYRVVVDPISNESNLENNSLDVFIEVLDARQKVLLLATAPHPDLGALRQAIEDNENYELETKMADEPVTDVKGFNLVILHQLPSAKYPLKPLIAALQKESVPVLVVVGQQTDLRAFNELQTGITIIQSRRGIIEAQPTLSEAFALFTISNQLKDAIKKFPPLVAPFAEYRLATSADVMLFQRIGTVTSDYPLIVFNKDADNRGGVISGEGIWRWRVQSFMDAGTHLAFNEMINKMVQFLSVREDRGRFRIVAKYDYPENEDIIIEAELYNEAFELVNEPEVQITLTDDVGINFPFSFSRRGMGYFLNAGTLPSGRYSYEATTNLGGTPFLKTGEFTISPVKAELTNTRANHGLLYALTSQTGGKLLYPGEMSELKKMLAEREEIKPVVYAQKKFSELVHLKGIFAMILILLTVEWFMRKWFGGY